MLEVLLTILILGILIVLAAESWLAENSAKAQDSIARQTAVNSYHAGKIYWRPPLTYQPVGETDDTLSDGSLIGYLKDDQPQYDYGRALPPNQGPNRVMVSSPYNHIVTYAVQSDSGLIVCTQAVEVDVGPGAFGNESAIEAGLYFSAGYGSTPCGAPDSEEGTEVGGDGTPNDDGTDGGLAPGEQPLPAPIWVADEEPPLDPPDGVGDGDGAPIPPPGDNPPPAPEHQVNVAIAGAGTGTVTGPDIDCPGDCSELFDEGNQVTLHANPTGGSQFAGWSGDCAGLDDCELEMDDVKAVTATFDPPPPPPPPVVVQHTLNVNVQGAGSGTVTAPGIDCPGDCIEVYDENTIVTLIANAAPDGSQFAGWSGGSCSGQGSCQVNMNAARSVTAEFDPPPPPPPPPGPFGGDSAIIGLDGVDAKNNSTIDGSFVASNGLVSLGNNSSLLGIHLGPEAPAPAIGNNSSLGSLIYRTVEEGPWVLQDVEGGDTVTNNQNTQLGSIGTYTAATRRFTIGNNRTVTIPAGTYNLCSISFGNNVTVNVTGEVRLLLDSPDRLNSGCPANSGTWSMGNNANLNNPGPASNLQIFMYGYTNGSHRIDFRNNGVMKAAVYAPRTYLYFNNNGTFDGGLAAGRLGFKNNADFTFDSSVMSVEMPIDWN